MAKQFSTLSLFLLCLLASQVMIMPSEAVVCSAPSSLFSGLCFSDNNCSAICEKEGFVSGVCKGLKCICQKDCNGGGGSGGGGDGGDQGPPEQGGGDQSAAVNRKILD